MNESNVLGSLNEDQREAAVNFEGPSFILAGPGSGNVHVYTSNLFSNI